MVEYTLVVVDMQPNFSPAESVVAAVAREIMLARTNGQAIVFLEIPGWGWNDTYPPTCGELTALVREYQRYCREYKTVSDGSIMVIDACQRRGFCSNRFRVCGAFADACVRSTVQGLLSRAPEALIEVLEDACHPSMVHTKDWKGLYPQDARLTFVEPVIAPAVA